MELAALLWLCLSVATASRWWPRGVERRTWLGLAGLVGVAVAAWSSVVVWGAWHANLHGLDRLADVRWGTPMPAAALSLLHGAGFYAVYQPLHDLGGWLGLMPGTDGPDVPWISAGLTLATLGLVFGWVRRLWDDEGAGLWAVALLAGWPLVLRLGVTESMYVPAVFFAVASLSLRSSGTCATMPASIWRWACSRPSWPSRPAPS